MSGTDPHYKSKLFFWKWKARKSDPVSGAFPEKEKTPFWTSWSGSLLIHAAVILLLLTVFQIHRPVMRVLRGRPDGEVSLVFTDDEPGGTGGGSASGPDPTPDGGKQAEESLPDENRPEDDSPAPDGLIGQRENAGGATARVRFAAGGDAPDRQGGPAGTGEAAAAGNGSGQAVRFGELTGRGKRFVYLIDHSESMKWPDEMPMNYAISEARLSIASLEPKEGAQKFQLILFNHHSEVFDGGGRLIDVAPESKRLADDFLRGVRPEGGTDPLSALHAAIRLAPDVIFFLTDAEEEISALALRRIHDLARRTGVSQIHVIEFGKPGGKHPAAYRRLAEENGGAYVYKDVTGLK